MTIHLLGPSIEIIRETVSRERLKNMLEFLLTNQDASNHIIHTNQSSYMNGGTLCRRVLNGCSILYIIFLFPGGSQKFHGDYNTVNIFMFGLTLMLNQGPDLMLKGPGLMRCLNFPIFKNVASPLETIMHSKSSFGHHSKAEFLIIWGKPSIHTVVCRGNSHTFANCMEVKYIPFSVWVIL